MSTSVLRNLDMTYAQWTVLLVFILITLLWKYLSNIFARDPRQIKLAKSLPGPPAWPLVGNLFQPLFSGPNAINNIIECPKKYGPIYRLWIGKYLAVCFSDAEDVEEICSSSKTAISKAGAFETFRDAWGDGMFTAHVPLWKKTRKIYSSLFSKSNMHHYSPSMNDVIKMNVQSLKKFENGSEFNSWNIFPDLSFGIIMKTQFDLDASKMTSVNLLNFHNLAQGANGMSLVRMTSPWCQFKFIDKLFFKTKLMKLRKGMEDYVEKILKEKHSSLQNIEKTEKNYFTKSVGRPDITEDISGEFINIAYKYYLETRNKKLLYDEIITMLAGGTDTAAITLGFTFLALAASQDIQNHLYEEINDLFGDSDRDADIADLDRLPYLEQPLMEALRLYPIVPILLRNVDEDTTIGNYFYPAGTQILINVIGMHYSEKYYANPTKFDPEHFSKEARYLRPKHAFLPFGGGPRMCLGMNFAMIEMKLFMIAMLREYSFHTTTKLENLKLSMQFFMVPEEEYTMSIQPRKKV